MGLLLTDVCCTCRLQKFFEDSLDAFAEDKSVNDAATALGLASPEDKLPSLRFSLMAHQVLGVHWMLSMERNKNRRGGLLCDSMVSSAPNFEPHLDINAPANRDLAKPFKP